MVMASIWASVFIIFNLSKEKSQPFKAGISTNPLGGKGIIIYDSFSLNFFMKGANKSIGTGKMRVEFLSVATSVNVCKNLS